VRWRLHLSYISMYSLNSSKLKLLQELGRDSERGVEIVQECIWRWSHIDRILLFAELRVRSNRRRDYLELVK
jgi:hypothetical protein